MLKTLLHSFFLYALCAPAVLAQGLGDVVRAELLTGWREADGRHMAAVRLVLEPGWKTYWRAPGDAGIPPRFNWSGSENLKAVRTHWPVPEVFHQNGLRSVGYSGAVTIPVELMASDADQTIALDSTMEIGVCEEVCVPVTLRLRGDLVPGSDEGTDTIRAALSNRPMTKSEAGVGRVTCRTEPISDGLRIGLTIDSPSLGTDEAVIVELADRSIWVSEPESARNGRTLTAVAEMVPPDAKPFSMARSDVRITVIGGGRAIDIRGCEGG